MTSSRILLFIALFAVVSLASAQNLRFRNSSNSSNTTNTTFTAPAPVFINYGNYANHSNHSNSSNTTNTTRVTAPAPVFINYGNHSNHSNSSNNTNTTRFTAPAPVVLNYGNHSNHSNSSNTTNNTRYNAPAAPAFITFPSTPFFNFPRLVETSNHSNHSNHSNTTCTREIAGQTFDLCAFKHPINTSFYVEPYFAANFTFNLLNNSLYDCNGTSGNSWLTARNNYGQCVAVHNTPAFNLTKQHNETGLKIDYQLEDGNGKVSVHLICNKNAPHNAHLDFNFTRTSNLSLTMTAQSYYGCPVNSNNSNSSNSSNSSTFGTWRDFGRKFLEF